VSTTHPSYLVAEAFRCSHIVLASATYNNGIFDTMQTLVHDLSTHNLQNRKVAVLENGSWAPVAGKLIRAQLGAAQKYHLD
jgi:flavorubredoxin